MATVNDYLPSSKRWSGKPAATLRRCRSLLFGGTEGCGSAEALSRQWVCARLVTHPAAGAGRQDIAGVLDRWAELTPPRQLAEGVTRQDRLTKDRMEVRRCPRTDCRKSDRKTVLGCRRVYGDPERVEFCFGLLRKAPVRINKQAHGLGRRAAGRRSTRSTNSTNPPASGVMRLSRDRQTGTTLHPFAGKLNAAIEPPVGHSIRNDGGLGVTAERQFAATIG